MPRPALLDRLLKGSLLPPAAAAALVASAIWLAAVVGYAAGLFGSDEAQPGGLTAIVLLIAALLPLGMLLSVAAMARETAALRAEIAALRTALGVVARPDAAREAVSPGVAKATTEAARAAAAETARALAARLDRLESALRADPGSAPQGPPRPEPAKAEPVKAEPARRPAPAAPPPADAGAPESAGQGQPDLPFRETAVAPVGWGQIARALDFPRDEADAEGFAALRAALADPQVAQLLQAAEDVLTLLASDGLHMEDLSPRETRIEDWRAYAEGARGAKAAGIGGVDDPEIVARVRARVKRDAIFRDACLVFARRWATLVQRLFRDIGDDPAMLALAESRSGRAFMLTARAMGAFD